MTRPKLKLVGKEESERISRDIYAYESEQRRKIASKDWAALHTRADKRAPVYLPDRIRRMWR